MLKTVLMRSLSVGVAISFIFGFGVPNAANANRPKIKKSNIAKVKQSRKNPNRFLIILKDGTRYVMTAKNPRQRRMMVSNFLSNSKQNLANVYKKARKNRIASSGESDETDVTEELDEEILEEGEEEVSINKKASEKVVENVTSTSTASTSDVVEEEKSNWGGYYLMLSDIGMANLHGAKGKYNLFNQLGITYKLGDFKLALKPAVSFSYDLDAGAAVSHTMHDTIAELGFGKIADLGSWKLTSTMRYYIPTGESARKISQNGVMWGRARLSKSLTDSLSMMYTFNPRYYWQSQRANAAFDEDGRLLPDPSANTAFRLDHGFDFGQQISKKFGLEQYAKLIHIWKYADEELGIEGEGLSSTILNLGIGFSYSVMKSLSLSFYIDNNNKLGGEKGFSLFDAEKNSYVLVAFVPF